MPTSPRAAGPALRVDPGHAGGMPRSTPPFRADHVGSLLRPPRLMDARAQRAAGEITADELRAVEDDGHPRRRTRCRRTSASSRRPTASSAVRRGTWTSSTSSAACTRPTRSCTCSSSTTPARSTSPPPRCASTSRITLPRDDLRRRVHLPRRPGARRPRRSSPSRRRAWCTTAAVAPRSRPTVYPDLDAFWDDLSAAYAERGARARRPRLHVPAARRHEPRVPQRSARSASASPRTAATAAPARALHRPDQHRDRRAARAACGHHAHVPRATSARRGPRPGGYDFVAEALFSSLDVDGFFLEYDDERSGAFEPLRFVPPGKMVVLGLVTTKRGAAGEQGRPQATHRRGEPIRPARAALPVAAVRLLVHRRGQRADLRRGGRQASAHRRDRGRGVGRPVARSFSDGWRAPKMRGRFGWPASRRRPA